jgi:hypothetical protein
MVVEVEVAGIIEKEGITVMRTIGRTVLRDEESRKEAIILIFK